jgi:hypothetical protein
MFYIKQFTFVHNLTCLYKRRECRVFNTIGIGGPCPHAYKLRRHTCNKKLKEYLPPHF